MSKSVLQVSGTITSAIFSLFALHLHKHQHVFYSMPSLLASFSLILSVLLMVMTGVSYFESRKDHQGSNYILCSVVGLTHIILGPLALTIAGLKIDFGKKWWVVFIGIIVLILWTQTSKTTRS